MTIIKKYLYPLVKTKRAIDSYKINNTPYYRTYPYNGRMPITTVDKRGVVDFELGIFFNRIPKAANSTIAINLAAIKFGETIDSKVAKSIFATPSSLKTKNLEQFNALYKFTFVRNPYSRILSAYLDKIARKKQHLRYSYSYLVAKGPEPSFDDFCEYLGKGGLHDNIHWAPQTSILLLPLNSFDFIGKIENLEADLRTVMQSIGHANALPEIKNRPTDHNTGADTKIEEYYTPKTRAIISELYKKDFELLEYTT